MRAPRHRMPALVALSLMACGPPPGAESGRGPVPEGSGPSAGRPAVAVTTVGGLRVSLSTPGAAPGEPLQFTLAVANETGDEAVIDFPDGQRFDFEVFDDGASMWRWAADMFFPQVLGRERVPAGDSLQWSTRLEKGLAPGEYRLRGTLTRNAPVSVELRLTIPEQTGEPSP